MVSVNFVFPMSSEVTIFYSNLIKNLYVQFWGRGEKNHPNGCRAYSTLRKWGKKRSQWLRLCSVRVLYKKVLQRHSLHFGVGGGTWLGIYSGQQSYLLYLFTLHLYRSNFWGNTFYTESFWLELQLFFIN